MWVSGFLHFFPGKINKGINQTTGGKKQGSSNYSRRLSHKAQHSSQIQQVLWTEYRVKLSIVDTKSSQAIQIVAFPLFARKAGSSLWPLKATEPANLKAYKQLLHFEIVLLITREGVCSKIIREQGGKKQKFRKRISWGNRAEVIRILESRRR